MLLYFHDFELSFVLLLFHVSRFYLSRARFPISCRYCVHKTQEARAFGGGRSCLEGLPKLLRSKSALPEQEPDPVLNGDAHHPGLASEEPVLRIKDTSHAELLCNMKPQRLAIDDEQARLVSLDPEFQESLVKGSSENISLAEAKSAQGSMEATDDFEHAKGRVSRISATSGVEDEKGGGVQVAARDQQTNAVRHRLRLRLGAVSGKKLITAKSLHNAIEALGLTTYTEEHCNDLVNQLADYIDLKFVAKDKDAQFARSNSPGSHTGGIFWENERNFGRPVWNWPKEAEFSRSASREIQTNDLPAKANANVVPIQALMDLFLARDSDLHKKIFGPFNRTQFQAMKEILLAGDTNRLVAELTFVRINDLAAPPESINPLMYIEPFVSFLIIANGIMIGFQTDRRWENWSGWPYIEGVLAFFLLLESSLRFYLSGPREFACGPDWLWNWFDFFLMLTGVTDVVIQAIGDLDQNMGTSSLLRFCRLIRLVRVVKVFRLKCMKELRLMVKGLVAGLRTLLLAFALLFTVLYVISGFATMTIGRDERTAAMGLDDLFADLPQSMFTAFRCYSGECMSARGEPIQVLLAENFGFVFVFCYVVTYMLVALGIFNVILAVYVDITMRAAKETEAVTSEQHARESIRIARTTRELLKKFAQAYRLYQDSDEPDRQKFKIDSQNTVAYTDEDINDIAFSKELFLLVIQDRNVQALMDDLDLPPDRANLFEVIDADGSGTMDVTELVQGMLKIRGDVKKSDTVATLLATKALQEMVSEMRNTLSELESRMIQNFPASAKVSPIAQLRNARRMSGNPTLSCLPAFHTMIVCSHALLLQARIGRKGTDEHLNGVKLVLWLFAVSLRWTLEGMIDVSSDALTEAHADTAADDPTLSAHLEMLQRIKAESPGWRPATDSHTFSSEGVGSTGMYEKAVEQEATINNAWRAEATDPAAQKSVRHRLQVRLNILSSQQLISGKNLHDAVTSLGLTTYTVEDMNDLVNAMAAFINLRFVKKEDSQLSQLTRGRSTNSMFSTQEHENLGKAVWQWPSMEKGTQTETTTGEHRIFDFNVVPAKALMDIFLRKDAEIQRRIFPARSIKQFQAMREILLAGDTNKLVAELTFVRINDLAAPPEAVDALFYIEPVVCMLILVNGILIGFQTDPRFEHWPGWPYVELAFAILLVLECCMRVWLSGGLRGFFCSSERLWNLFDLFLVCTAVTDVSFQLTMQENSDMFGASLLRFCRLIRLVRVVKVFRLNYMKELRLMVKGLVGGIRTLLLAFALLFAVLYVIAGFATMTIGRDSRTPGDLQGHFENIPQSMFTSFRCFSGECFADTGAPIASVMSSVFGWPFVLSYVLSYMLVSMGIFNVILAVYVDITMRAAKETEATTAEQYS
ncbi:Cacna1e, partial [Symbiodinium microadriaticum]